MAGPVPKMGEILIDSRAIAQLAAWGKKTGRLLGPEPKSRKMRRPLATTEPSIESERRRVLVELDLSLRVRIICRGSRVIKRSNAVRGLPRGVQVGFWANLKGIIWGIKPEPQAIVMRAKMAVETRRVEKASSSSFLVRMRFVAARKNKIRKIMVLV
ncbi:MAG: hypothetical protein UY22_C0050G0016 [Candidatus Amesbacteria bacterium GW2011_GWC1_48_10]|uniref:Uncharacterized protein n=1 Tax=Candidatus Amesbacteria bacterium GW2011_GWC1_48_10 TaxID=1618365 RepID=A0A0G1U9D1_9BACT|nr:MAG: hypothetical protein UY22_C0050G0016 [Candidatus Amesbacteria bacterium GW2011_GWC1_48_10]